MGILYMISIVDCMRSHDLIMHFWFSLLHYEKWISDLNISKTFEIGYITRYVYLIHSEY